MAGEFRLSPESEANLQRTMLQRQQRFAQAQQQVNEEMAARMVYAQQVAPTASSELKQAFAATPMAEQQLMQLAQQEAAQRGDGGLMARVGDVLHDVGMGAWNQIVKPSVRGAFTLVEGLAQEAVQRPLTALMTADPEGGTLEDRIAAFPGMVRENYNRYGDSALVNLIQGDRAPIIDERGNVDPLATAREGALGHGLFPGGTAGAATEQERRLTIQGEKATFGRAVARGLVGQGGYSHVTTGSFYTPGDAAYDVTSGIAQFTGDVALDPSAWATFGAAGAISRARQLPFRARTLGQAVRGISPAQGNKVAQQLKNTGAVAGGRRNTVLVDRVERLLRNPKVIDQMAEDDAYTIFKKMKGHRLGIGRNSDEMADLIRRLGATSDRNVIANELLDSVRRGWVREAGFYKGSGKFVPNWKEMWRTTRIAENLPEFRHGGVNPAMIVSPDNRMQAAIDIDAMLRNSKVGEQDRARIFQRTIETDGPDAMMDVVDDAARTVGRKMEDIGVEAEDVDAILNSARKAANERKSYLLDEFGRQDPPPFANVDEVNIHGVDEAIRPPKASLLAHLNRQMIPLFDPQDLRRATQKHKALRTLYQSNGWELADSAARFTTRFLFKFPTLFTRVAYPLRNNLDNQARTAGAGYVSLFTNPRAWINMGVSDPNKFRELLTHADGALARGRGFSTVDGRYGVVDEIIDEGTENARVRATITRDGFGREVKETIEEPLAEFRRSQVAGVARTGREVATESGHLTKNASGMWEDRATMKAGSHDVFQKGVHDEFIRAWREELGHFVNDSIASAVANTGRFATKDDLIDHLIDDGVIDEFRKYAGPDAEDFFFGGGDTPLREAVSQYVDWTEGHIRNLTNGNQRLRHLIATADLNGVDFNDLTRNKRIDQILREQYFDDAPHYVSGSVFLSDNTSRARNLFKQKMDWWVDFMASSPENRFTRHPLMQQIFADDLAHSMPSLADDALRAELVQLASRAGFDDRLFPHIAQAAQDASGQAGVIDNIEDVLDAAKLHSGDRMLDIAFDATRRSSFQEMADAIFPFYDAFVEVGQSWGRILKDNPNAFIKGTQAYDSLRTTGQFYVNEHGSEVFQYPGGGLVAKALGLDLARPGMEANVSGLNLIVQGFGPGFGPVVQWGAGALMPDTPDLQWARDLIFPFGTRVDDPGDILTGDAAKDLMPAWLQKGINAYTEGDWDEVAWNSAWGDAVKAIATTRDHDPSDPKQVAAVVEDAKKATKWTMFIRSMLQMGMPTGPSIAWEIQNDPNGDFHRVGALTQSYYEILEESGGDYQVANQAYIEIYGHEPFWIAQGKTRELIEGPRTREGFNWLSRRQGFAEQHKEVAGYFVPAEDPEAPPDYGVYRQRVESGELQSLTGEQLYALANKTKATQIYYAQRERIENSNLSTSQQREKLRLVRSWLTDQFPGWNTESISGLGSRIERDRQIELLGQAVQHPSAADSPVTEPLSVYLQRRNDVMAELQRRSAAGGDSTLEAQSNSDLREWLFDIGKELSARSGEFRGVWQTLLSSEVDDT